VRLGTASTFGFSRHRIRALTFVISCRSDPTLALAALDEFFADEVAEEDFAGPASAFRFKLS
jgi:hypothetical protein